MDLVNVPCHIIPHPTLRSQLLPFWHHALGGGITAQITQVLLEASVRWGRLHLWLINAFFRRVQKPISKPHTGGIYTVTWFCCCSLGLEGAGGCVGLLTGRAQLFQAVIFKKLTLPNSSTRKLHCPGSFLRWCSPGTKLIRESKFPPGIVLQSSD